MVKELVVKTALHELRRRVPYHWDLNLYRGCAHGCKYCYAISSHRYLDESNFSEVYVKSNILEVLEKELAHFSPNEIINLGGVTDAYQPAERECKLMPEVLRLMIKYQIPVIISTKSDLVLRDIDLISKLAEITYVNLAESIVTTDDQLRQILEPGASPIENRFRVLKEFSRTKASTGLHMMPILPGLTDSDAHLEELVKRAAEARVDYILPGTLYFTKATKAPFFRFLAEKFPNCLGLYEEVYQRYGADKSYKESLYPRLNHFRQIYDCTKSYMEPIKERLLEKK